MIVKEAPYEEGGRPAPQQVVFGEPHQPLPQRTGPIAAALNAPVAVLTGSQVQAADLSACKSIMTAKAEDSRGQSKFGSGDRTRMSQRAQKESALLPSPTSHSRSPNRKSHSRSRERHHRSSPAHAAKQALIHVTKIEKTQKPKGGASGAPAEEEPRHGMDRFSSQGQEELVQAYQLPTSAAGNDARVGFHALSQYPQNRSNTFYGNMRKGTHRTQKFLEYTDGSAACPTGALSSGAGADKPSTAVEHPYAAATHQGFNSQTSQPSHSRPLGNLLVKACSF